MLEQQLIVVVLSVARRIKWWGKQHPVGIWGPPVRLPLKVRPVARCAIVCIQTATSIDIAMVLLVTRSSGGGRNNEDWDKSLHATFTNVRIPPAA